MPICGLNRLDAHAEIAGDVPDPRPALKRPGDCRVAQGVRCHVCQARVGADRRPARLDTAAAPAPILHGPDRALALPAAQMRQQAIRQARRGLALAAYPLAISAPVCDVMTT